MQYFTKSNWLSKTLSVFIAISFLSSSVFPAGLRADILTPPVIASPVLKYLSVNPANPNNYFNFLMDKGSQDELSSVTSHMSQVNQNKGDTASSRGAAGAEATEDEMSEGVPSQLARPILSNNLTTDAKKLINPSTVSGRISLDKEAAKLIRYFFLGLSLPQEAFWVNLQPNQQDKLTSEALKRTDLGKILLEQDLQLKKDVARYLHPDNAVGKVFWTTLYQRIGDSGQRIENQNQKTDSNYPLSPNRYPLNKLNITTNNRVWVVPDQVNIAETEDGALITKASLKVLLESEYLRKTKELKNLGTEEQVQNLSESLMKQIIIPEITKDVNTSSRYAPLRQIYHSLILAQWYKQKQRIGDSVERIGDSKNEKLIPNRYPLNAKTNPYAQTINSNNTIGLESTVPWSKDALYQEYLKSYKQGEYNVRAVIAGLKRMYFSGGINNLMPAVGKKEIVSLGITEVINQENNLPKTPVVLLGKEVMVLEGESAWTSDPLSFEKAMPVLGEVLKDLKLEELINYFNKIGNGKVDIKVVNEINSTGFKNWDNTGKDIQSVYDGETYQVLVLEKTAPETFLGYFLVKEYLPEDVRGILASLIIPKVPGAVVVPIPNIQQMHNVAKVFSEHMAKGLNKKESSLPMYPSFLGKYTGNLQGEYLAIDWGGSTIRLILVKLTPGEKPKILKKEEIGFKDDEHKEFTPNFDKIAEFIKRFQLDTNKTYALGFTFSFPLDIKSLNEGVVLSGDKIKGWNFPEIKGKNIVDLLQEALTRNSINNVLVKAVLNDTVGTQLTIPSADMALIFGTGFNISLLISGKIYNLEACAFNGIDESLLTSVDNQIFEKLEPRNGHLLEKLISGKYLGEIVRLNLLQSLHEGKEGRFIKEFGFTSELVSIIEGEENLIEIKKFLEQKLSWTNVSDTEAQSVKDICREASLRTSKLLAAVIVSAYQYIDPELKEKHLVAVDGSVYEKHPHMKEYLKDAIIELVGNEKSNNIQFELTKDGSGIGAAIAAGLAEQVASSAINSTKTQQDIQAELGMIGSGVFLPIAALPSGDVEHGIGDLGQQARNFIDFLSRSGQRYWQILPLNPTDEWLSAFNSDSVFALNVDNISPEDMISEGWISREEAEAILLQFQKLKKGKIDNEVKKYKNALIEKAYENYKSQKISNQDLMGDYQQFRKNLSKDIYNYVLFRAVKKLKNNAWWLQWDEGLKNRDSDTIKAFEDKNQDLIESLIFGEFLIFRQEMAFKKYADAKRITIIGDMPIYVKHDSADVWANRSVFMLDKNGNSIFVSGSEPDAFSDIGQTWGHPIYQWQNEETINFLKRRFIQAHELYHKIRVDHFRGFVDPLAIPAGKTALDKGAHKIEAKGDKVFDAVLKEIPDLANFLVAEDLGVVSDKMKETMRRYGFIGMKVQQFIDMNNGLKGAIDHMYALNNFPNRNVILSGTSDTTLTRQYAEGVNLEVLTKYMQHYGIKTIGVTRENIADLMMQLMMRSSARIVIHMMQDILYDSSGNLGLIEKEARNNIPGTWGGDPGAWGKEALNWKWRVTLDQLIYKVENNLKRITEETNRTSQKAILRFIAVDNTREEAQLAFNLLMAQGENNAVRLLDKMLKDGLVRMANLEKGITFYLYKHEDGKTYLLLSDSKEASQGGYLNVEEKAKSLIEGVRKISFTQSVEDINNSGNYNVEQKEEKGEVSLLTITSKLNKGAFSVNPIGFRITSLKSVDGKETLHENGIPIGYPWQGRINKGEFSLDGTKHDLKGIPGTWYEGDFLHGMIQDKRFKIEELTMVGEDIRIKASLDTKDFPQIQEHFGASVLKLNYTLKKDGQVSIEWSIKNTDSKPIPVTFGIHPWGLASGETKVTVTEGKVKGAYDKNGNKLSSLPENIDISRGIISKDVELDYAYEMKPDTDGWWEITLADGDRSIVIRGQTALAVVWNGWGGVIAVEPQEAESNAVNRLGSGNTKLQMLEPRQERKGKIVIDSFSAIRQSTQDGNNKIKELVASLSFPLGPYNGNLSQVIKQYDLRIENSGLVKEIERLEQEGYLMIPKDKELAEEIKAVYQKVKSASPVGGIDLASMKLEIEKARSLPDAQKVSSAVELQSLYAAYALSGLKWDGLAGLYFYQIMLMIKDGIAKDLSLEARNRLIMVGEKLKFNGYLGDNQSLNFFNQLKLNVSIGQMKFSLP